MRRIIAAGLCAAAVLFAGSAPAQDAVQIATRRDLLTTAEAARARGDHARALDLARRALSIVSTPSVQMFAADEEVALGRFVAALADAEQCASAAAAATDATLRNRTTILTHCNALRTSLPSRLGHVRIHLPSPAPDGLQVTLQGGALTPGQLATAVAIDPGTVVIEAHAPGRPSFRREVQVVASGTADVDVPFETAAVVVAPTATVGTSHGPPFRVIGIAAGIGAVVLLGGAAAALAVRENAASMWNDDSMCLLPGLTRGQSCGGTLSTIDTMQTLEWIGFIGGGVLAAAAVTLVVAGSGSRERHSATVVCGPVLLGQGGIVCSARF